MNNIWEVVQEHGFLNMTARQLEAATDLNKTVFYAVMTSVGSPVEKPDCVRCFSNSLTVLKRLHKESKMAKSRKKQKYSLKDVGLPFKGMKITQKLCTDDTAKEMLKLHPEYIAFFSNYPANWQDEVESFEVPQSPEVSKEVE